MKCPYCGKYKAKEVDREENFNFSDANIDIVLLCCRAPIVEGNLF